MVNTAVIYFLIVNVSAFVMYGLDKAKAKRGKWRISEKALFLIALAGGSIGAILGMHLFRHKTKHWYFRIGLPVILILQLVLVWFAFGR